LLISYSIINKFLALKRQHVRPIRNRYVQARQVFDEVTQSVAGRVGPPVVHEIQFDLQTISQIKAPVDQLEQHIAKISIGGRGLAAALEVVGSVDALHQAMAYRDDLIADAQTRGMTPEKYFGIRTAAGVTDEKFSSNITALYSYTDDCIFFAQQFSEDLLEYGNKLRARYHRRLYRLGIRKFQAADWSIAEREGLVPPMAEYQRWLRGFRTPRSRWSRVVAWVRRRPA
jgi:hypothetical protein